MLGSSIQTTPAAMKQAVLDAATGGMSPTSKAKFIKYNCSDCGGDLMAGDGPGTDVTGKWRSMSHNKHWTKQKLAEARAHGCGRMTRRQSSRCAPEAGAANHFSRQRSSSSGCKSTV